MLTPQAIQRAKDTILINKEKTLDIEALCGKVFERLVFEGWIYQHNQKEVFEFVKAQLKKANT